MQGEEKPHISGEPGFDVYCTTSVDVGNTIGIFNKIKGIHPGFPIPISAISLHSDNPLFFKISSDLIQPDKQAGLAVLSHTQLNCSSPRRQSAYTLNGINELRDLINKEGVLKVEETNNDRLSDAKGAIQGIDLVLSDDENHRYILSTYGNGDLVFRGYNAGLPSDDSELRSFLQSNANAWASVLTAFYKNERLPSPDKLIWGDNGVDIDINVHPRYTLDLDVKKLPNTKGATKEKFFDYPSFLLDQYKQNPALLEDIITKFEDALVGQNPDDNHVLSYIATLAKFSIAVTEPNRQTGLINEPFKEKIESILGTIKDMSQWKQQYDLNRESIERWLGEIPKIVSGN